MAVTTISLKAIYIGGSFFAISLLMLSVVLEQRPRIANEHMHLPYSYHGTNVRNRLNIA
jgi:hypothetical protein